MRLKTFKQGIHPKYFKELSSKEPIKRCPFPKRVIIPLSQHTGIPCKPLVEKKDKVERGQKIGEADGFIAAPIHSSITGIVKSIDKQPFPRFKNLSIHLLE